MSNMILKGEYREDGGILFTRSHTEKTRGSSYKLNHERLHLLPQRLLAGRIISPWKNFLRGVVEPLLLEALRTRC